MNVSFSPPIKLVVFEMFSILIHQFKRLKNRRLLMEGVGGVILISGIIILNWG